MDLMLRFAPSSFNIRPRHLPDLVTTVSLTHDAGAVDLADSRTFPSRRTRSFAPSKTGYGEIDKEATIVGVPGPSLSRPCLFIHILE
jgi:hypothetical protein